MQVNAIRQALDFELAPRLEQESHRWGGRLRQIREARGLSRMELAQRMGYQKLQRGAAKIARWERGDDVPRGDRIPLLARHLGLAEDEVASQARREQRQVASRGRNEALVQRARAIASAFDARLLGRHSDMLLARHVQVSADLAENGVRVAGALVHQSFLGGVCLDLDELLHEWLQGRLVTRCGDCRGVVLVQWGAGSSLSGRHRVRGFCARCDALVTARLPPGAPREHRLAHVLLGVKARRKERPDSRAKPGAWSLGQYLASVFGIDVPDIHLTNNSGAEVARYDHASATLEVTGGDIVELQAPLRPGPPPALAEAGFWKEQWGAPRVGGKLVLGSLSPARGGSWQGQSLSLVDDAGGYWSYQPGVLCDPSGRPALRFDGPLPPGLLQPLSSMLLQRAPAGPDPGRLNLDGQRQKTTEAHQIDLEKNADQ